MTGGGQFIAIAALIGFIGVSATMPALKKLAATKTASQAEKYQSAIGRISDALIRNSSVVNGVVTPPPGAAVSVNSSTYYTGLPTEINALMPPNYYAVYCPFHPSAAGPGYSGIQLANMAFRLVLYPNGAPTAATVLASDINSFCTASTNRTVIDDNPLNLRLLQISTAEVISRRKKLNLEGQAIASCDNYTGQILNFTDGQPRCDQSTMAMFTPAFVDNDQAGSSILADGCASGTAISAAMSNDNVSLSCNQVPPSRMVDALAAGYGGPNSSMQLYVNIDQYFNAIPFPLDAQGKITLSGITTEDFCPGSRANFINTMELRPRDLLVYSGSRLFCIRQVGLGSTALVSGHSHRAPICGEISPGLYARVVYNGNGFIGCEGSSPSQGNYMAIQTCVSSSFTPYYSTVERRLVCGSIPAESANLLQTPTISPIQVMNTNCVANGVAQNASMGASLYRARCDQSFGNIMQPNLTAIIQGDGVRVVSDATSAQFVPVRQPGVATADPPDPCKDENGNQTGYCGMGDDEGGVPVD
ncbi:MAG: hypothetical protein AB7U41_01725 [Dongiaceae bacterium]